MIALFSIFSASSFVALVRSGSFFEVHALIMFISRCILPPRACNCEMHPYFMVTALILFTKTQSVVGDREHTMQAYFPLFMGVRWLEKPSYISPFARHGTCLPQWCGARWHRQIRIGKGFFNDTDECSIVAAWAAPSGTVEVPSNQVHMLFQHHSADCKE